MKNEFISKDATDTIDFAKNFAKNIKGGEVIELVGDVGSGKTTLVRGLAAGLGSSDNVSSPTFTVEQIYHGDKTIHHFDFYRLPEPGLVAHELSEALEEPENIVVVEWAGTVKNILPKTRTTIRFEVTDETERKLFITNSVGDKK